ncbi:hypothetical protein RZE82_07855 [Mollicutes bacterium LVI A0039]|nr:hypothetical protein RZE82_07855 [Mollicutes bacterium LVI A0039]
MNTIINKIMFLTNTEWANVPKIENLIEIQNVSGVKRVYGEDVAETKLDNAHAKLYLLEGSSNTRDSYMGKNYKELSKTVAEEELRLVTPEILSKNPFGIGYLSLLKNNPTQVYLRPSFTYIKSSEN